MRHYSNLQFAIQTLYFASIGALGSVAFVTERSYVLLGPETVGTWACLAAVVLTLVFFLLTLSCERHRKHFEAKALRLERDMSEDVVDGVPASKVVGANTTMNFFYIVNVVFWTCILAIRWRLIVV